LSVILNKSLKYGEVPARLKMGKVVPIYKAKENYICNNYRPISLLPCVSNILEKLMRKRLYTFLMQYHTYCTKVNMDCVQNTA